MPSNKLQTDKNGSPADRNLSIKADTVQQYLEYIRGLIESNDSTAEEVLLKATEDSDPRIRAEAAYQIGTMPHSNAFVILKEMTEDKSIVVRALVVEGLHALGTKSALDLIISWGLRDSSEDVRAASVHVVASIASPEINELILHISNTDESIMVRNAAKKALLKRPNKL